MKLFAKFGLVALATGAFLEVGLPVKAGQPDWVNGTWTFPEAEPVN